MSMFGTSSQLLNTIMIIMLCLHFGWLLKGKWCLLECSDWSGFLCHCTKSHEQIWKSVVGQSQQWFTQLTFPTCIYSEPELIAQCSLDRKLDLENLSCRRFDWMLQSFSGWDELRRIGVYNRNISKLDMFSRSSCLHIRRTFIIYT